MIWRGATGPFAGLAIAIGCLSVAGNTEAQSFGDVIVGVLKNAMVLGAWSKVDQPTKDCLVSQYNVTQDQLVGQGILPSDSRVAPYIQNCQQVIAAQQQQQSAQQDQQSEQQREQAALVAQQSSPALKAARKRELSKKYGKQMAALILSGQLKVGMSKDEVTEAWGNPTNVDTITLGQEKWNYGSDTAVFTNGKLSDVEH